jgi:hypothetical protein
MAAAFTTLTRFLKPTDINDQGRPEPLPPAGAVSPPLPAARISIPSRAAGPQGIAANPCVEEAQRAPGGELLAPGDVAVRRDEQLPRQRAPAALALALADPLVVVEAPRALTVAGILAALLRFGDKLGPSQPDPRVDVMRGTCRRRTGQQPHGGRRPTARPPVIVARPR